jgi:hypothetical protein
MNRIAAPMERNEMNTGFAKEAERNSFARKRSGTAPAEEPQPDVWLRKEPEIRQKKEPLTIASPAPLEIPTQPESW